MRFHKFMRNEIEYADDDDDDGVVQKNNAENRVH